MTTRRVSSQSKSDGGGDERIILFTRYPEPGITKTRLVPKLGPDGAAELHRKMTEHTLDRIRMLAHIRPVSIETRYAGGDDDRMKDWLGCDLLIRRQWGTDLGTRLTEAFHQAFREGMRRVIIVGTDCPALTPRLLTQALQSLHENDLVLGPAVDGGYYLVGLRRAVPELFRDVKWGTDGVLQETLRRAAKSGLAVTLLQTEGDVDRPEDLHRWERVVSSGTK